MAESDPDRRHTTHRPARSLLVLTGDSQGSRVVVKLVQSDVEFLDHVNDEIGKERGTVGIKKFVESPPDTIVVDQRCLCV